MEGELDEGKELGLALRRVGDQHHLGGRLPASPAVVAAACSLYSGADVPAGG